MTPHERELIVGVADVVRSADRSAIDPEAERLIRAEIASQPNAAYILTQRVIVQQLALRQAQARIDELEGRSRPGGRSFLGGADQPAAGPPGGPPGGAPAPQSGGGVGSFLKTAAAAAAGTIGAQLIYDGLRHYAGEHLGGSGADQFQGTPDRGGFLPGYESDVRGRDQGRDWGGGGDFGSDQPGAVEEVEEVEDDDEIEEADEDQDEWEDDDSGSDDDDGGGGSW